MALKLLKYGILLFLGAIALYQIWKHDEYCTGIMQIIWYLLCTILFVVVFLFISGTSILTFFRTKTSFDFIPLILFILFTISSIFLFATENMYFFKNVVKKGTIARSNLFNNASLILFDNGSFEAKIPGNYKYCVFTGTYEITDTLVVLNRKNLSSITDNVFTKQYRLDINKGVLISLDTSFENIELIVK